MRRMTLLAALLALLALPSVAQAQLCGGTICYFQSGGPISTPLGLPDGTAAAPSIYNVGEPLLGINFGAAAMSFTFPAGGSMALNTTLVYPGVTDSMDLGYAGATRLWKHIYTTRGLQGSKAMALTAGAATTFVTVSIPQTALVNFAAGEVIWTVRASDATDIQTLQGRTAFSCQNKGGTEACAALVTSLNTAVLGSAGAAADDLACTFTAVTGLVDSIGLAANCATVEMTETSLAIIYRLDMPQVNTVAPGT